MAAVLTVDSVGAVLTAASAHWRRVRRRQWSHQPVLPAPRAPAAMVLTSRDGSRVFTAAARAPVTRTTMRAVVLKSIARAIRL
jgi:hypothetical protein